MYYIIDPFNRHIISRHKSQGEAETLLWRTPKTEKQANGGPMRSLDSQGFVIEFRRGPQFPKHGFLPRPDEDLSPSECTITAHLRRKRNENE